MTPLLEIRNLHVRVDGKDILRGMDLMIGAGEIHAIMGPNGSGKSTLSYVLAGKEGYEVIAGSVHYDGKDLLAMEPEDRAREGFFLGFQYPVEIPGVANANFLKTAMNAVRKHRGLPELDAVSFLKKARETMKLLQMDDAFLGRGLNVGFSGGEKKRNEVFQMAMLEPRFAVLDELDSGLDIDALKAVSDGVNAQRGPGRSMLLITHYQRLLGYVQPDKVHIMAHGRIVRSGGKDLALELESKGYAAFVPQAA